VTPEVLSLAADPLGRHYLSMFVRSDRDDFCVCRVLVGCAPNHNRIFRQAAHRKEGTCNASLRAFPAPTFFFSRTRKRVLGKVDAQKRGSMQDTLRTLVDLAAVFPSQFSFEFRIQNPERLAIR
jgi:hypothetical protein